MNDEEAHDVHSALEIFFSKVALKVINRREIKEEYVNRNLHREARILMELNHPNIVNFYEELSQKELYCLSMEYVRGVDLLQYLKKQESFRVSECTAKCFFYQMISAVDHMHRHNILHRDLKQENILLEHGRVIKIIDFGLSNIYQPNMRLRTHCGSMVYAAPELFQNWSVYGAGVDLWSLGVILYAMVVGRMPFELSKRSKDNPSYDRKDLFLKRILQGLNRENWEQMQMLSIDCCNLIQNLLQPDQFKRMQIRLAMRHPWFQKDYDLKRRLPQHRTDLREKLTPEIIDFMADKMCASRERVKNHIKHYKFDKVSAIFYILQDTLMKDVLYPPKDIEKSFLFKFELWRKSRRNKENESKKKEILNDNLIRSFTNQCQLEDDKKFPQQSLNESHRQNKKAVINKKVENSENSKISKRIGDGKIDPKSSTHSWRKTATEECVPNATKIRKLITASTVDSEQDIQPTSADSKRSQPFKSYKNSRPNRGTARTKTDTLYQNPKTNDTIKIEEADNNHSNVSNYSTSGDKLSSSNSKDKNLYKLSNHRVNKNCDEEERNAGDMSRKTIYSDNFARKEAELRNQKSSHDKILERVVKPNSNIRTNELTSLKLKQFTEKVHKNADFNGEMPEKNQSYLQRNIIISRADRGSGRVFVNSKIPMKSMRYNPETYEKSSFLSEIRKSRNYESPTISSHSKKS